MWILIPNTPNPEGPHSLRWQWYQTAWQAWDWNAWTVRNAEKETDGFILPWLPLLKVMSPHKTSKRLPLPDDRHHWEVKKSACREVLKSSGCLSRVAVNSFPKKKKTRIIIYIYTTLSRCLWKIAMGAATSLLWWWKLGDSCGNGLKPEAQNSPV